MIDEGRLLTRQGFLQYIADNNLGWREEYQVTGLAVDAIAEAQDAKTASIYQQKIEEIFEEIERVSQDIDEDGKSTDDPAKVIETIYYIGKGRLRDFKDKYKKGKK